MSDEGEWSDRICNQTDKGLYEESNKIMRCLRVINTKANCEAEKSTHHCDNPGASGVCSIICVAGVIATGVTCACNDGTAWDVGKYCATPGDSGVCSTVGLVATGVTCVCNDGTACAVGKYCAAPGGSGVSC